MKLSLWSEVVALVGKVAGWDHGEHLDEPPAPSDIQVQRGKAALRRLRSHMRALHKQGVDHETFRKWVNEGRRA